MPSAAGSFPYFDAQPTPGRQGKVTFAGAPGITNATTTQTSDPIRNPGYSGVLVIINATAAGVTGLQLRIQVKDPNSGQWINLNAAPTAITSTTLGAYGYEVSLNNATAPGGAGNVAQRTSGELPADWRVQVVHGDATASSYTVGYLYVA